MEARDFYVNATKKLIIEVDGYQELVADLRDSERSHVMEALNRTLEQYFARTNGFLRRVSVSRYIAVVDGFPLTASGKIQKFKLREMAAERWPEAMAEPDSKTAK